MPKRTTQKLEDLHEFEDYFRASTILSLIKESVENLNQLFGSPTRAAIVLILKRSNNFNKLQLFKLLKEIKVDISYKNLLWTLDKMKEEKLITFKRIKKEHNSVYLTLNKKIIDDKFEQALINLKNLEF